MSKLDTWIDNRVMQNLFIWLCLFLILLGTIQSDDKVISALFIISLLVPAVYINNLLILPFFSKNRWRFLLLFVFNIAVFTAIASFLLLQGLEQEFKWSLYFNLFGILILALTFGSAMKISRDSFVRRQEDKSAQLKLLKAQLNPHFLFNTLNNLYGLSVLKSDKLPDLMLKLSDLLRYSLYETKDTYVSLEKEITYLENYISLEKIRLEESADIQFSKSGNLSSKQIAPMLLIVFVENAFKHLSVSETVKNKVVVSLEEHNNNLMFTCTNTVDSSEKESNTLEKGKSGIGLQNVKKRLALMYPEKHQLTISNGAKNEYHIKLALDL